MANCPQPKEEVASRSKTLAKYIVIIICVLAVAVLLLIGGKILFIVSVYASVVDYFASAFGLDVVLARLAGVLFTSGLMLVLPTLFGFLVFGRNRAQVFIGAMIMCTILSFALFFGAKDVFFDRIGGGAGRYYIMTLEGMKFSNSADVDPKWGIRFKAVTPEVMKQYYFWKRYGKYETMPAVQQGKYFDMLTGEPIVWYVERRDGEIVLLPLPGYDPKTGKALRPMTTDMVAYYEQYLKREAEKRALAEQIKKLKEEQAVKKPDNVINNITFVGKLSADATTVGNLTLRPEQLTDCWYSIQRDLTYSFVSNGPGFDVLYQDGEVIRAKEESGSTPVFGRPGPFKIQAQKKTVRVTLLINRVNQGEEISSTGQSNVSQKGGTSPGSDAHQSDNNANSKQYNGSGIFRWTDERGIVHFQSGHGELGVETE